MTASTGPAPFTLDEFAADRADRLKDNDAELEPVVRDALILYPTEGWVAEIVEAASVLWSEAYDAAWGDPEVEANALADWASQTAETLERTATPADPPDDAQVQRIAYWLSTSAANGGTDAAAASQGGQLTWVTMRDANVREMHRGVDGEVRDAGDTFDVGGYQLSYPGQPVGPPEVWINCRCLLAPAPNEQGVVMTRTLSRQPAPTPREVFATGTDVEPEADQQVDEAPVVTEPDEPMQWYGVLAPEGVPTGDGRMFSPESLRHRDLPIPLRYVKEDVGGHDGAVVVGNIKEIWREGANVMGRGEFRDSPEAAEAVDLIAQGMMRGVSVDLDDATVEYRTLDGQPVPAGEVDPNELAVVTDGRISAATLVAIPAFAEAFVSLGTPAEADQVDVEVAAAGCLPCEQQARLEELSQQFDGAFVSDKPWSDFTEADYTDEQWFAATCLHKNGDSRVKSDNGLPVKEPGGALNRNGVHAAAARFNQVDASPDAKSSAAACLRGAYNELGEEPPEAIAAASQTLVAQMQAGEFAPGTRDGPGWLTNPADSQRLRDYWARGAGAAKIRWGEPGDFNRCRTQLAKYIKNPQWLAGTCANLHKVALGVWPGQEAAADAVTAAAYTLVEPDPLAAATGFVAPSQWFADPQLDGPTKLTVTADGRVFGHAARWDTCHTAYPGECKTAPHSTSGYAYFATGSYLTSEGEMVPVGTITMNTGHASTDRRTSPATAMAHYDNTATAAAYVAVGEDEHGIWVAGTIAPGLSEEDVVRLRGAKISGDWRFLGGDMEMIAALAVNTPGFPVTSLAASGGHTVALVAAGVVGEQTPAPATVEGVDMAEFARQVVAQMRAAERREQVIRAAQETIAAEVRRIETEKAAARAAKVAAARAALEQEV